MEVLTPDFCGDLDAVARVLDAGPHVFNHNMETVPRLYRKVRPQADYRQSLEVLAFAREYAPRALTKSGFMVGLGETAEEVRASAGRSARGGHRCGHHRPVSAAHAAQSAGGRVRRRRSSFEAYREYGLALGFKMVFSGPLVRSSYMADAVSEEAAAARLAEDAARLEPCRPEGMAAADSRREVEAAVIPWQDRGMAEGCRGQESAPGADSRPEGENAAASSGQAIDCARREPC